MQGSFPWGSLSAMEQGTQGSAQEAAPRYLSRVPRYPGLVFCSFGSIETPQTQPSTSPVPL